MPGIFGAVRCDPGTCARLTEEFAVSWEGSSLVEFDHGILGGHAFGAARAVFNVDDRLCFAVDGEAAIYRYAADALGGTSSLPFDTSSSRLTLDWRFKGNVAIADRATRTWYLATDWTGGFPLYYTRLGDGLLFSSHLRPIARATRARRDPVGVIQFLLKGYNYGPRTHFEGVHRLMPGQILRLEADNRLELRESSQAWVGFEQDLTSPEAAASEAWAALVEAVRRSAPEGTHHALMMSGGWDSRTLLAAMCHTIEGDRITAYSHGDRGSRELRLAQRIAQVFQVETHQQPITGEAFELDRLARGFERVENIVFPHWHRAGTILGQLEAQCVSSGVYGGVLGGHYGRTTRLQGFKKMLGVASTIAGHPPSFGGKSATQLLSLRRLERPWYLDVGFWEAVPSPVAEINADIDRTLARLASRGVRNEDQLIEAFLAETRGTQYMNAQILSCRVALDVANPFGDRDFLLLASRTPLTFKIHNTLNRQMLRLHAPNLLRFPCAATLVPAAAPIIVQEASRLVRRSYEQLRWATYLSTRGRLEPPHLGWVNFEFLRDGRALSALVDDLKVDIWDRSALRSRIEGARSFTDRVSLHQLSDQLLKVYTTDQMLRS